MLLPDFLTQDELGSIRLTGHRIGLAHLLHGYQEGYSPEMLWNEYPTLPLSLIHKVIAFYLEQQADVDAYLAACHEKIERQRSQPAVGPSVAEMRQRLLLLREAGRFGERARRGFSREEVGPWIQSTPDATP